MKFSPIFGYGKTFKLYYNASNFQTKSYDIIINIAKPTSLNKGVTLLSNMMRSC